MARHSILERSASYGRTLFLVRGETPSQPSGGFTHSSELTRDPKTIQGKIKQIFARSRCLLQEYPGHLTVIVSPFHAYHDERLGHASWRVLSIVSWGILRILAEGTHARFHHHCLGDLSVCAGYAVNILVQIEEEVDRP